jgi:hypothetical protein
MPKIVKVPRALRLNGKSTTVRLERELWAKVDAVADSYGMNWQALLNQASVEYAARMMPIEIAAKMLIDKLILEHDSSDVSLAEFDSHPIRQACNTWGKEDLRAMLENPAAESIRMIEGEANHGGYILRFGYYDETPIMVIENQLGDWHSTVFTLGAS